MIDSSFSYLTILLSLGSLLVYIEYKSKLKLFEYLPAIVILYFLIMTLSTLGAWSRSQEITDTYRAFKSNLLPAMIFLMLLQSDIRKIFKLGKKILFTFFLASFSIALGFVIAFNIFHNYFDSDAWKAFGALSGSWLGGTGNMVAIQGALNLPDSKMGYVLLIDSIDYAIWVMILLSLVPFASKFNRWVRANGSILDNLTSSLNMKDRHNSIDFPSLFFMFGLSLFISLISQELSKVMPTTDFLTKTTWIVIFATIAGILAGFTPLNREKSAQPLANIMLYFIVALIASRANFNELTQAPIYILTGFTIILIHASIMIIFAKIFRLDLFSLGVASLANIGGVASAPILAGAYNRALIPIGVLMAMMGYIIGTLVGLSVARVLEMIAN